MFRVLDLPADGPPRLELDAHAVAPPPPGITRWVDLVEPDPAALDLLRQRFSFDALPILDCAEYGRQSKVNEFERYLFIVIHAFTQDPSDPLGIQIHEIHAFLGPNYLVTVHDNPVPAQEAIWQRAEIDPHILARGVDWALYLAIEAMVHAAEPLVERLRDELDDLERAVIEDKQAVDLSVAFRAKRAAVAMRRVLRPLRDTLNVLHRRDQLHRRTAQYLRDLTDHVVRLVELVEEAREVATGVVSGFQALEAARGNEVIKRLTVFSAVFLPLSFIVGFWGQNFVDLPYDSGPWLAIMLVSLVAVPLGLMEWFRRHWL